MMKYYTGIGARKTPQDILNLMVSLANTLAKNQYTLRSGGADGADSAFELGCDQQNGQKEIFLPWKGFNHNSSQLFMKQIPQKAHELAEHAYGPRWANLSSAIQLLMIRNVYQILGTDLNTPSEFVVCWTPDGCQSGKNRNKQTGGTGQAITIATMYNVPVLNLKQDQKQIIECICNSL